MTINELNQQYTANELTRFPGDLQLRYKAFAPLLINLFENKAVYYEGMIGIIKMEDLIITPERFQAKAVPYLLIERDDEKVNARFFRREWIFGSTWSWLRLIGEGLSTPYCGWKVWTEPGLVSKVEALTLEKKFEEVLDQTLYAD